MDRPFHVTNTLAQGNADPVITNYVHSAFNVSDYNPDIEYYLTLSAEDSYTEGGSWWQHGTWASFAASTSETYSGWCADGPNTARNITTNFLIRICVTDDDIDVYKRQQWTGTKWCAWHGRRTARGAM